MRDSVSQVPFLDLSRRIGAHREQLDAAAAEVLSGGRYVLGPAVARFEETFAGYCGASHAVGVASGTDAVALALAATGTVSGDEVITAANTCAPTVAGIVASGATPVLADVDPRTATLDPRSLELAITGRTKAVVPVHLYGQCADMDPILDVARAAGLRVVEDAAQAHGAELSGRRAGVLGDAAAFSFYPTKNLGAIGDAGAVVTDDEEVAARVRMFANYGYRERDDAAVRGRNSRLDELQAAFLNVFVRGLDADNARRRELALAYLGDLAGLPIELPFEAPGRRHAWHLFAIRAPQRDELRRELESRGIGTLVHYPRPIHHQSAYEALSRPGRLEVSERLCAEVLSLPLYPELTEAERRTVTAAVQACVKATHSRWSRM